MFPPEFSLNVAGMVARSFLFTEFPPEVFLCLPSRFLGPAYCTNWTPLPFLSPGKPVLNPCLLGFLLRLNLLLGPFLGPNLPKISLNSPPLLGLMFGLPFHYLTPSPIDRGPFCGRSPLISRCSRQFVLWRFTSGRARGGPVQTPVSRSLLAAPPNKEFFFPPRADMFYLVFPAFPVQA